MDNYAVERTPSCEIQGKTHLEQVKGKIKRLESDLVKLKKAQAILEKNEELSELMDIIRSVGFH